MVDDYWFTSMVWCDENENFRCAEGLFKLRN